MKFKKFSIINFVFIISLIQSIYVFSQPIKNRTLNQSFILSKEIDSLKETTKKINEKVFNNQKKINLSDWFAFTSIIVSLLVMGIYIFQYRAMKKTIEAGVSIDLFNAFREDTWTKYRTIIEENKKATNFEDVKPYSYMLNHFGFLLEHEYIDVESIYDMMGKSVITAWEHLSDQILKLRDERKNYAYQYHFQYLS